MIMQTPCKPFPSQAKVVVIGGGIVGCSVAYHLSKLGIDNTILIERKSIGSGTSFHAAGMIREQQATEGMTWLSQYTNRILPEVAEFSGIDMAYRQVGSLYITNHPHRVHEFEHTHTACLGLNIESTLLKPDDIADIWPLLNCEDLLGGFIMPNDALVNPYQATLAFAKAAEKQGVAIFENTKAMNIVKESAKVIGVETDQGFIQCDAVVICGGVWSRDFASSIEVNIPLHGCEHYYIISEALEGVHDGLPAVRDFDARCYLRPSQGTYWDDHGQRLMCGFFEEVAKPWGMNGIPEDFAFAELEEDWQHLETVLDNVKHRVPALQQAKIEKFFNGPESFTYDNSYLLGEVPNCRSLFVGTGLCSRGIQAAGGMGYVLADLIKNRQSTIGVSFHDVDIARCSPFTANRQYLHDRAVESLGLLYSMHYPFRQLESARPVKQSPWHDRLGKAGACFGEAAGWERANFYVNEGADARYEYSFQRQNWFEASALEHHAVREGVGVFDLTSFAKFLVQGKHACELLNRICASQLDVAVGKIVYTQALDEQAGIQGDWTITRLAEDQYWVITGVDCQHRDFHFINHNIRQDEPVCVTDITSAYAVLGIMGPNSRELLRQVSNADFSHSSFPYFTSQVVDFGYARVRANRLSYAGELGWEVYIPSEFALSCFDQLHEGMQSLQHSSGSSCVRFAGYHALNSLRLEKGFRHWGHDISPAETPLEAGLGFTIDFNKQHFNGKQRLLNQKEQGVTKRMVSLKVLEPQPLLNHFEPIYRNGVRVGFVTSGMFCHSIGSSIGLAYVQNEGEIVRADWINQGQYEITIMAKNYPIEVQLAPFYDPKNERVKR